MHLNPFGGFFGLKLPLPPGAGLHYGTAIMRILLSVLCLGIVASLSGCALWPGHKKQPKSSAHIYAGDAPTVHMTRTESAGGYMSTY